MIRWLLAAKKNPLWNMDPVKNIRKEYLLDEMSRFVSFKAGIIKSSFFRHRETGNILDCPRAISSYARWPSGAGADLDAGTAMIKSLAESLERYTFLYARANGPIIYNKSAEELKSLGYSCFYPEYDLYEDFVYKNNPWLKQMSAQLKIDWAESQSFLNNKQVWLPATYIHNYSQNIWTCILKKLTSNGMSCSFLDSAIEDSLLELIERDAFLYMWLAKSPGEEIIFDQIHYKPLSDLLETLDFKRKQIKVILKNTDTKIPCFFVIFKGEKKYNEPAFFISGSADMNVERGCYRALLEFTLCYGAFPNNLWRLKKIKESMKNKKNFFIQSFKDRTAYYSLYENFSKCAFLFDVKGQKKLSDLAEQWKEADKKAVLKEGLKGKDVFVADITPKEIEKTDIHIVRSYSPDLMDLDSNEGYPFNSSFKKKRVSAIDKALKAKNTLFLNKNAHCYP